MLHLFKKNFLAILILVFVFVSCNSLHKTLIKQESLTTIPDNFPNVLYPDSNEFTLARWELGKKLFYDNILSVDSTLSCASCHKPEFAFSDNKDFSPGVKNRPGKRNAPSLANVAYHPYFLREGGVPTLEMQVLVPIQEENEFNHNIIVIGNQLKEIPEYVRLSKLAYNRDPDYYVITRALGVFERTLISGNSKYDLYLRNKVKLTQQEKNGLDLFFSERASCSKCHEGFNFTNYSFQNNGLYESYKDIGRFRFTKDSLDLALFKVPSLRNVEVTSPYMHDGSISSLEEVIDHYNLGGENHKHKNQFIKPLSLSEVEKASLISFLKTLTDNDFINNKK